MATKIASMITELPLFNGRLLTDREQEEFREEGRKEGREEGRAQGEARIAYRMMLNRKKNDLIHECTGLSIKEIDRMRKRLKERRSEVLKEFGLKDEGLSPGGGR